MAVSGRKTFQIITIILALCTYKCLAQIRVDTTKSAEFLVMEILIGQGILVGNVTSHGAPYAIALFTDSTKQVGIGEGILLSSGNVYYVIGPNRSPRSGWASNTPGDEDLDQITHGITYDAAVLEFDFITSSENLSFNFVFASEEYQEYVGSKFNDVFGFFLTGPNADHVNLATLPGGNIPITINNVNHEKGTDYYVDNPYHNTIDPLIWDVRKRKVVKNKRFQKKVEPPAYDVQFDGFTVVLAASYKVIPNEIYHIKMAVADVSDGILDSGVFLEAGSFQSSGDISVAIEKTFDVKVGIEPKDLEIIKIEPIKPVSDEIDNELDKIVRNLERSMLNIEFAFNSFEIPDSSYQILQNIYQILEHKDDLMIEVIGHTDDKGSKDYNIKLSKKRSNAVIQQLIQLGVTSTRIECLFLGESQPVGLNSTTEGRARNRRVEFVLKASAE